AILDNDFDFNSAGDQGGGLFLREDFAAFGGFGTQRAEIYLTDNRFNNNQSGDEGGGAYLRVAYGNLGTLEDPVKFIEAEGNQFQRNTALRSGGGLRIVADDTVVTRLVDSEFFRNVSTQGDGGGLNISVIEGTLDINGLDATLNDAGQGHGGGLAVAAAQSDVSVASSYFDSNYAGDCGGGLHVSSSFQQLGISRSVFLANSSASCGGGLSLSSSSELASNINFKYNAVVNNAVFGTPAPRSKIEGIASQGGGGLFAQLAQNDSLRVSNSTVSGNQVDSNRPGGGLQFDGPMSVELKYSTVVNNETDGNQADGAGVFNTSLSCTIGNTILADNVRNVSPSNELPDNLNGPAACMMASSLISDTTNANFTDGGNNLLDIDPLLGVIADNGGATFTHAPQPGSPVIDAGMAADMLPLNDQRGSGFPRVFNGQLDMGAYEVFVDAVFSDRFQNLTP
ncbi:MAG: choice-of-anchor Q domain-containing protein, partial [Pseudomonadota bacterium]